MIKQYLQLYHELEHAHAEAEADGNLSLAKGCLEELQAAEIFFIKYFNLKSIKWDKDDKEPANV